MMRNDIRRRTATVTVGAFACSQIGPAQACRGIALKSADGSVVVARTVEPSPHF